MIQLKNNINNLINIFAVSRLDSNIKESFVTKVVRNNFIKFFIDCQRYGDFGDLNTRFIHN